LEKADWYDTCWPHHEQAFCEFYSEHKDQFYFQEMVKWLTSDNIMILVVKGENAIEKSRYHIVGKENSGIRGQYKVTGIRNLAHTSDSTESFLREITVLSKYVYIPSSLVNK
jgi:nucleoside-diphosphate kinase